MGPRGHLLIPVALLTIVATPALVGAVGTTGPFHGVVVERQTNAHVYSSSPPPVACVVGATWTVTLTYGPASDILSVAARGHSDQGSDGYAAFSFEGDCWESFTITVTGVNVATLAAYRVTVTNDGAVA